MWKSVLSLTVLLTVAMATVGEAATDLPRQLQAGQHRLILNGSGTRTKTLLQLYVAGLYLTQPSNNSADIVAANEPMAIRIKITSGFVSQENLVSSLAEGFSKATGGRTAPIQPQIDQFRNCFRDAITKGDTFDIVYVPERGVIVNKNGKFQGAIAGIDFKRALFSIWLSEDPTDKRLKQALLTNRSLR